MHQTENLRLLLLERDTVPSQTEFLMGSSDPSPQSTASWPFATCLRLCPTPRFRIGDATHEHSACKRMDLSVVEYWKVNSGGPVTHSSLHYYIRQVNAVNGGDIVMLDSVHRSVTSL